MESVDDARALLLRLGAPPHLVKHHELVAEVADELCERLEKAGVRHFDRREVVLGAAIHDAGKIRFPEEMHAAGSAHELAGREMLLANGVDERFARHCVLHAAWETTSDLEALLVATADKIWKGKRVPELEEALVRILASRNATDFWSTFETLDPILESLADEAPGRLERSVAY